MEKTKLDICESKQLKENAIKFYKDLFTFSTNQFHYVIVDGKIWIRGKDVALYLDYKRTDDAIRKHVNETEKITLEKLEILCPPQFAGGIKNNEKNTIYITIDGLTELALKSKKAEAEDLRKFIIKVLLPSVFNNGYYNIELDLDTSFLNKYYERV